MGKRGLLVVLAVIVCAGMYGGYRYWVMEGCECGAPERTPFTTYNPFRDRQPEGVTTRYLQSLHDGTCSQLPTTLFVSSSAQAKVCAVKYPLNVWEYRSRESYGNAIVLGYSVGYGTGSTVGNLLAVDLDLQNSEWRIEHIDTYY